ncbi:hypothetical protein I79_004240 [Cricetulus griseus]|uniref:Uncharacterized protein n=1 Tax=Cricetulus griseus TaxID=10029 RepID=G3H273_CRIGR|nr:hypothetical protein I79_004240 [Cricetulus griseus]
MLTQVVDSHLHFSESRSQEPAIAFPVIRSSLFRAQVFKLLLIFIFGPSRSAQEDVLWLQHAGWGSRKNKKCSEFVTLVAIKHGCL